MRKNKLFLIALVAATVVVAGCSREHLRGDFGNSNKVNVASQVVNPTAGDQPPAANTVDGQKVEKALGRYRNDKPTDSRGKLLSELGNN